MRQIVGLVVLLFGISVAKAADTNAFEALTVKEPLQGRQPVTRAYVTCGEKKFTFAVPEEFQMVPSVSKELEIVSADYDSFITLRIAEAKGDGKPVPEYYRPKVLARFTDTVITEEFSASVAASSGPGFDISGKVADGPARRARIIYVPLGTRVLEFALVASPEKFKLALSGLHTLVETFRVSDATEKFDVATFSDRI